MDDTPYPAEFVAVESAGKRAGISPRTLRHWIATGKLPAIAGKRGKLVSIAEVRRLALLTGKTVGNPDDPPGNPATSADPLAEDVAGNLADNADAALVTDTARQRLATIRDEWLQPLIDRIGELERQGGRLEAERDAAREEVADLRERLAQAAAARLTPTPGQDSTEAAGATEATPDGETGAQGLWRRLRRALGGG